MTRPAHSEKEEMFLFASLFIFESSLVVMAMAMYIKGERPFSVFLSRGSGTAFLCAIAAFFIAGWVIVHRYLASKRLPSRQFRLVVMTNLVTVLCIVITGEIIVRAGSQSFMDTEAFGNVVLKPRNWERAKLYYRQLYEKSRADLPLLNYDDQLGWTVGQNRYSPYDALKREGPYWSVQRGSALHVRDLCTARSRGRRILLSWETPSPSVMR